MFINADHIELRHALMYETFDRALGGEFQDWSGELHSLYTSISERSQERRSRQLASIDSDAEAVLPLNDYAGSFRHELFGDLEITHQAGRLRVSVSRLLALDLKPAGSHRFLGYPLRRGFEDAPDSKKYGDPSLVQFEVGPDNRPRRVLILGQEFERMREN